VSGGPPLGSGIKGAEEIGPLGRRFTLGLGRNIWRPPWGPGKINPRTSFVFSTIDPAVIETLQELSNKAWRP